MQRAVFAGIISVLVGVGLAVGLLQERQGDGATLEISTDPSRALVNVTGPEGFMSMLDLSGPETLTDLPPGRYFIVATSPDHSVGQAEIELSQGARESVALSLETLADAGRETGGGSGEQTGQEQDGQQQDGQQQNGQQQNGQQSQVGGGGQAQSGQQGEQAYQQQCAQCHGGQGEGGSGPALAGNQNLQQPQMVIDQILNGGGGMPAFGEQLSDEQIAAIATHEMNSWGNQFGEVSADQVQQQRDGGQGQGQQQDQQEQGQQQQSQQQQPEGQSSQQGQQQAQGQQAQGQQAQGQQGQGQQGQGQSGQPDVQVQRGGDATRIEIMIPGASDAPVSLNLQLEIGASQPQAGGPSQSPEGEQVAGGGQSAGQGEQAQEQGQQQDVQQQGVQQQGQQAQDQQEQDQATQSSQQPDPASQGTLQIVWVQPAGASVTITGPDGFSRQMNLTGGTVFEGLRAGSYTVTATSPGYESASKQVEVEARQTANVSLSLQQQSGQQRAGQQQQAGQQQAGQQQAGQQQAGQQQSGQQETDQQQTDQQQSDQQQADRQVAGGGQAQQGSQIYSQQCAQCHGQEGEGGAGPALAGNQAMQDAQAVVTQILQGGGGMPAFGNQLSDEQVAAVATHEMNSWGNQFGEVTPDQVSGQRKGSQQQSGQQQNGQQQSGQQQNGQQQNGQQQDGQQTDTSSSRQQASWFTAEQARRGMQEYASHCAVCHGGGLQGRASYPALVGEDFLGKWQGRTAAELFEYISTKMPQDRPGKLGHLTYTYLTAYVLDQNGLPAGQTELAPESGRLAQLILPGPSGDGGAQQEGQPPAPVGQETEQPEQDQQ